MPLLFIGACVWVAGTALGLRGEVSGVVFAASVAAALWWVWRGLNESRAQESSRIEGLLALALLFATGLVLGNDLRRTDARCSAEAQAARSWDLTLRGDAEPGSFTMATLGEGCRLHVALAVKSGSAPAGSSVRVTRAEPSLGDRGLMLRDGVVELKRAPSLLGRWRNHVARTIDARFGADAGLAKALLIADTHGLSPELRERYTDAGLVHILSISGLHVGIIGGALLLLVEALRLPVTIGRLGAVALVMLYVLAIGAPAAAMRSAALFASVALARVLQRPTSVWATFSIGALVPLIEPRTVLDLGWQLSVAGYAGVLAAGRAARRLLPDKWRGWRGAVARELIAGVLTTMATAPLVAWHFGRLSLVAIVSNLGAGPVVALLQPTLFLAMLVPSDFFGRFVADAARPLMRALDAVASAAASVPFAAVSVAPTMVAACIAAIGVVAVMTAAWSRHWRPWATLALSCVAWLAWAPAPQLSHDGQLEVHLLDVGQGDAVALRTPRGRWVIIDAGREWKSGDAGRATVVPYVRRQGGALALFVLTHPHADHVGGAASVIRALRPARVRDAAFVAGSPAYAAMLNAARDVGSEWARVTPGEQLEIDGVQVTFLAPDSAWTVALNDPNEASTIVRVDYGSRSFLFTGDAEHRLEEWLIEHASVALDVDVLKAGHHGSSTSSGETFVDAVTPRIALVSVGVGNTYGHPNQEVMTRLREAGAAVLRTDQLGTIIVRSDGQALEVQAAGHRWTPKPLPD